MPSSSSRNAPPPVEIQEIPSATPNRAIADKVSPPPATDNPGLAAMALARAAVPAENCSNSNTPTGPFHRIVAALRIMRSFSAIVFGPISRILSSGSTSARVLISRLARLQPWILHRQRLPAGGSPSRALLHRQGFLPRRQAVPAHGARCR